MSSKNFTIYYDGPALDNAMDVRDLAPALLAFGDMLTEANKVLNGDRAKASVQVKAFRNGCFGIDFSLAISFYESNIAPLFKSGGKVRDALEILNLLGITPVDIAETIGLFTLIKKLRGKRPDEITSIDKNNVKFVYKDGNDEIVNKDVASLYCNEQVRAAASKVIAPLEQAGIDQIEVCMDDKRRKIAGSEDVEDFAPKSKEPEILDIDESPQVQFLSIVSLSFKPGNKWRLSDGESIFNVKISDEKFWCKLEAGEINFAKGDMLKVSVKKSQSATSEGLKTEYEVVTVLEHKKQQRQSLLSI